VKINTKKMDWFKFIGLSIMTMNAGNAVNAVINENYIGAGISIAVGIGWIGLLEWRGRVGR